MKYRIDFENVDLDEFYKVVGFISEEIVSLERECNSLIIEIDSSNSEEIINNIKNESKRYLFSSRSNKVLYENKIKFTSHDLYSEHIKKITDGSVMFNDLGYFLYIFFDNIFTEFAYKLGALDKKYPAMLPIDKYKKTGYLGRSPQYSIFCTSYVEDLKQLGLIEQVIDNNKIIYRLKEPKFALSPSACFHTYIDYENSNLKTKTIVTFNQNVFRNEGRFNFNEIGRLRDYHVREIVIFGSQNDVCIFREKLLDFSISFIEKLNLNCKIEIASDPFILPKLQKLKKIQIIDSSKYELKISISDNEDISCASYNLHGTAFTVPFNINVENVEQTVSACVGFGIERWVLAFVAQYGLNIDDWPILVKERYYEYKKNSIR